MSEAVVPENAMLTAFTPEEISALVATREHITDETGLAVIKGKNNDYICYNAIDLYMSVDGLLITLLFNDKPVAELPLVTMEKLAKTPNIVIANLFGMVAIKKMPQPSGDVS